jgi:hypothetical protein
MPDAGEQDAGGPPPLEEEPLWVLTLVSASIPPTKPDGAVWDVGSEDGFAPPDVAVSISTVALSEPEVSDVIQDAFEPQWTRTFHPMRAASLESLSAVVFDDDLFINDSIGECRFPQEAITESTLSLLPLDCMPTDLSVMVNVNLLAL